MRNDLLFTIPKKFHTEAELRNIFDIHPEIRFVSLVGIDLSGNDTDERIPVNMFLRDIDNFLYGTAIQTDGSSVVLPGIATLNDGKVDMVADISSNWFVDYNYSLLDPINQKPIGTIKIPCFLMHNDIPVDSRRILKNTVSLTEKKVLEIFRENPEIANDYGITFDDIEEISLTAATELEFWVKTPNDKAHIEELTTSEVLQEQYWTRTKGNVRSAMEEVLILMDNYGFEAEMGHKEVGGVKARLDSTGNFNHIMEQLEIDWKYSSALQAADNELFIRTLIKETFRRHGLEVTFLAKPIIGVAGSGEHTHLGMAMKLKDGKRINLFTTTDENHFLSKIGYGSLMGMLKNYEIMNPFISSTNDSLKRLRPGFEAPICIVTSLGQSPEIPSRNRTILIGLIRDSQNPLATRFELRAPNPFTNTYLCIAVSYLAMLDGIDYVVENKVQEDKLLKEISKKAGEKADYLETSRSYRSEENVYESYTEEERTEFFGKAPTTVYENLLGLNIENKLKVLKNGDVLNDKLINSFKKSVLRRWTTEIVHRMIPNYAKEIKSFKEIHCLEKSLDLDISNWKKINDLRIDIMKDSMASKSLFTRIKDAINNENYQLASTLQIELNSKIEELRDLYVDYKRNLLDI
ncbi:MAG: glutamine synthetase [Sarcina sp.]